MPAFSKPSAGVALLCVAGACAVTALLVRRNATRDQDTVQLSLSNLTGLTERCIKQRGYTDREVQLITDVLLYAQVGRAQGRPYLLCVHLKTPLGL